jgi:predicted phosphate transport protein (TIGR00153 family)
MLGRLIPRDQEFFALFDQLAGHLSSSARLLHELFEQPELLQEKVRAIKEVEHKADQLTHDINRRIDRSFVTPIDREDIHEMSTRLDDVIDLMDGTARRVEIFHIREVKDHARRLSTLLVQAAEHLQKGVTGIKKPKEVQACAVEVKRIEEEADALYHDAVGSLFVGNPDPLDVIKWKEIYDRLESGVDSCMAVVNTLQSISIKNA